MIMLYNDKQYLIITSQTQSVEYLQTYIEYGEIWRVIFKKNKPTLYESKLKIPLLRSN
mgnify:CR=1 FL=1